MKLYNTHVFKYKIKTLNACLVLLVDSCLVQCFYDSKKFKIMFDFHMFTGNESIFKNCKIFVFKEPTAILKWLSALKIAVGSLRRNIITNTDKRHFALIIVIYKLSCKRLLQLNHTTILRRIDLRIRQPSGNICPSLPL